MAQDGRNGVVGSLWALNAFRPYRAGLFASALNPLSRACVLELVQSLHSLPRHRLSFHQLSWACVRGGRLHWRPCDEPGLSFHPLSRACVPRNIHVSALNPLSRACVLELVQSLHSLPRHRLSFHQLSWACVPGVAAHRPRRHEAVSAFSPLSRACVRSSRIILQPQCPARRSARGLIWPAGAGLCPSVRRPSPAQSRPRALRLFCAPPERSRE